MPDIHLRLDPDDSLLRQVWLGIGDRVEILDLDGTRRFMNETHVSSPLIGIYRGLLFTYPRSQSE